MKRNYLKQRVSAKTNTIERIGDSQPGFFEMITGIPHENSRDLDQVMQQEY
jgi:hypothetical protein